MTHLQFDHRSVVAYQHPIVFTPCPHWANDLISPVDSDTSALVSPQDTRSHRPHPVITGEVISSRTITYPARPIPVIEPKRSFFRRSLDDPYWILMTLAIALSVSIIATALYGLIQITLAIGRWFTTNGTTLATLAALVTVVVLCGGTTAAKCTGIHCGGCQR